MKRKLFLFLAGGVFAASVVCSFAQGTVYFQNGGPGVNAPVDRLGVLLSGFTYRADLYWALGTVTDSTALQSAGYNTSFGTGTSAGYFFGGGVGIPGTSSAGGQVVTVQIRAWDSNYGATWAAAYNLQTGFTFGSGNLFQVTLGNGLTLGTIPTPFLSGAAGFHFIPTPEPSSLALMTLGAGLMFLWRRRIGNAFKT